MARSNRRLAPGALLVLSGIMAGCDPPEPATDPAPAESDASTGSSATAVPSREGVLVTYQNGKEIGRERYRDDGASWTSQIKLGPNELTVTIPHGSGKVFVTRAGERDERAVGDDTIALENGSWQAYAVVAERFPEATVAQPIRVLIPSLDHVVDGTLQVSKKGDERVVEVVIAGLVVRAWVSPAGEVTASEVPAQSLRVLPEGAAPPDPGAPRATPDFVLAEAFELELPDANLRGDLWRPRDGATGAIMVIIAGSGPTDRDGNNRFGLATDTYRLIAEGLARRGVATVRYDKRGIGASTSRLGENEVTMQTFAGDAAAIVERLRSDARFTKVLLLGHSEGGTLAIMAAASEPVDGLALVAAPGRSTEEILREQLSTKLDAPHLSEAERILAELKAGRPVTDVPEPLRDLFRPSIQPFVRSQMKLDPPRMLGALDVPSVVIVQGKQDIQIGEADARALAAARPRAALVLLPTANHVLKDEAEAKLPQKSYADPTIVLSDGVIDALMRLVSR